jgi:hypothetical protein
MSARVAQRAAFGDHFIKSLPNREDHMLLRLFAVLALVVVTSPAAAQDSWLSKPITVIVPFGAVGNTDSLARIYSARLRPSMKGPARSQQPSLQARLIGTWEYVSSTAKLPDGSPLWGHEPKSLFILTENGRFSWQVFRSDRPKFASNNRLDATADELRANNRGSLAYFGTYKINEADKTITFRTEAGTYPNGEDEVITRIITKLTADEWAYTNPATTLGARIEAVWRRIK